LIELGAEVDPATSDDGTTPLTNAVVYGITGSMQVLLNAGAKVSLILAAGMGDLERAKSFFNPDGTLKPTAGTPPFKADAEPRKVLAQAINFAAMKGHPEMVRFLASRGAPLSDPDSFVKHNCTPLHRAALR
jgi:ankyrin repeat protein